MAHGDGTIKLVSAPGEDERWEVSVSLGKDPNTGKYRRKKRIVQGSYDRACAMRDYLKTLSPANGTTEQKEPPADSESASLELVASPAMTVASYEAEYLPPTRFIPSREATDGMTVEELAHAHAERKLALRKWAKSTERSYWDYVGRFVVPDLGQLDVAECTTRVIEEYYLYLMRLFKATRGKSAASTINEIHKHMKGMFSTARRMHLVTENPCDLAERPHYDKPEVGSLTAESMRRLLGILGDMGDNDFTAAIWLYIAGGLRPEEVAGLTWRGVNFGDSSVSVFQARTKFELKGPKSKTSRRVVALNPDAMEHLKRHKKTQERRLAALGIAQTEDTFVALDREGRPINVEAQRTRWRRFRIKHDIRTSTGQLATQHQLRHTYASLLVANGAPIPAVSKVLGHKDSVITSRIYVHALPGQERDLANMFGTLMAG